MSCHVCVGALALSGSSSPPSYKVCPADSGKYVCCNGNCESKRYEKDGDNDCGDNSDENGQWKTCHAGKLNGLLLHCL